MECFVKVMINVCLLLCAWLWRLNGAEVCRLFARTSTPLQQLDLACGRTGLSRPTSIKIKCLEHVIRLIACVPGSYAAHKRRPAADVNTSYHIEHAKLVELFTGQTPPASAPTSQEQRLAVPAACSIVPADAPASTCVVSSRTVRNSSRQLIAQAIASSRQRFSSAAHVVTNGGTADDTAIHDAVIDIESASDSSTKSNGSGSTALSGSSRHRKRALNNSSCGNNVHTGDGSRNLIPGRCSEVLSRDPGFNALSFLDKLPLFGRDDHRADQAVRLKPMERVSLVLRGLYLLAVFSPFLFLGVPLLLLSWFMFARAEAATVRRRSALTQQQQPASSAETAAVGLPSSSSSIQPQQTRLSSYPGLLSHWRRQLQFWVHTWVSFLCVAVDLLLTVLLGGSWQAGVGAWESAALHLRVLAWRLLLGSCRRSGAAFIKWGQWSSTRR